MNSVEMNDKCLAAVDCLVIGTDHTCYDFQQIAGKVSMIFDSRGVTRGLDADNIIRL